MNRNTRLVTKLKYCKRSRIHSDVSVGGRIGGIVGRVKSKLS